MSEFGFKIKNYQAGSVYGVMLGVREFYDYRDAMLTNSLFVDFLVENGLKSFGNDYTKDVICIEFNYGTRSYEEEIENLEKTREELLENDYDVETSLKRNTELIERARENKDLYQKTSAADIRKIFYKDGLTINHPKKGGGVETIHYKMLYRTPGKAKKGSCMFIRDSLYNKARNFLYMGLKLPKKNAPIVEIGAYSSLVTSTIVSKVKIKPSQILILEDVDCFFTTNVISIETNENKECVCIPKENYKLKNTIFDGQALIDSSIFPEWADGYVLLRQHFCKMAAFKSHIQKFFKDYFGDDYDTAVVKDMFGNEHLAKDIKLITTNNAMKWLKFDVSFDYWSEWVEKNGCMFGIVKTAHPSKFGNLQRTSYQMINSLDQDIMPEVTSLTRQYVHQLKTDDVIFFEYLHKNVNFANDFDVLLALCEQCEDFVYSEYFRERKKKIIHDYVLNIKNGRTLQNADNLTIVGSPYAMLLHSVGEDVESDPTFKVENDCIQCFTNRFDEDEYLAFFRSPFNSQNNMGYFHNVRHKYFDKYFDFGRLIIAINMIGTDIQDRGNGLDMDSDSGYVTNQPEIVKHAKSCYKNFQTIVNNIPTEANIYKNTPEDFALVDNNLATSQRTIGESSNLAQICLTYTYNFDDKKYYDYVCILAVLAQVAIDSAKRSFDVSVESEIERIKKDIDVKNNKYPMFWLCIRNDFKEEDINYELTCPMNYLFMFSTPKVRNNTPTIPMSEFLVFDKGDVNRKRARKIEKLIEKYSLKVRLTAMNDNDSQADWILLKHDFEHLVEDIRRISIADKDIGFISWLLDRAFKVSNSMVQNNGTIKNTTHKNKVLLLKTLYNVNPKCVLKCFSGKKPQ